MTKRGLKNKRFLFNVYKRFLFLSRFFTFLTFFFIFFFWNVFTSKLKSSASHASRENTLLRCGKFRNDFGVCSEIDGRGLLAQADALCCTCLFIINILLLLNEYY